MSEPPCRSKLGGKAVKRPWLGAKLQTVTPEIAESLGLRSPTGALVASVVSGSPAARAGLKSSDLITAIARHRMLQQHAESP